MTPSARLRRLLLTRTLRAGRRAQTLLPAADRAVSIPAYAAADRPTPLGCGVVRRVEDAAGRGWSVREGRVTDGRLSRDGQVMPIALIYRCDAGELPSRLRAAARPLVALDDSELVTLLEREAPPHRA